jgi:hypothetical protein
LNEIDTEGKSNVGGSSRGEISRCGPSLFGGGTALIDEAIDTVDSDAIVDVVDVAVVDVIVAVPIEASTAAAVVVVGVAAAVIVVAAALAVETELGARPDDADWALPLDTDEMGATEPD